MYAFNTKDGRTYRTAFSPREIAGMYCYDDRDHSGNRYIVLTDETDFKTFEFNQ